MRSAIRDARHGILPFARRFVIASAAVTGLLATTGCGGDNNGGSKPVDIRGNERLAWNQAADSTGQLSLMTFNLYVDGARSSLSAVGCGETASTGGYECSGGLPSMSQGRHALELTAVLFGAESTRSAALAVNMIGSAQSVTSVAGVLDLAPLSTGTVACVGIGGADCHEARVIADGLELVSSLSATPDGRLLFVEGGTRVRVIAGDTLTPEAALVLEDPTTRIVGLAVDHDFAASQSVFLAWTEVTRAGSLALSITRYREVQGVLGEGATIVTGLPIPEGASAPLAVDNAGLLYVALPAPTTEPTAGPSQPPTTNHQLPTSLGVILRFTRDGLTPRENPQASPILAFGYSRPTGLAFEGVHGRIWMSGERAGWGDGLAALPTLLTTTAPWPLSPQAVVPEAATKGPLARQLPLVTERRLYNVSIGADGEVIRLEKVALSPVLPVLAGTQGPTGMWYVSVAVSARESAVLRLERR